MGEPHAIPMFVPDGHHRASRSPSALDRTSRSRFRVKCRFIAWWEHGAAVPLRYLLFIRKLLGAKGRTRAGLPAEGALHSCGSRSPGHVLAPHRPPLAYDVEVKSFPNRFARGGDTRNLIL